MRLITETLFTACVGRKPEQDDMERVNCKKAGEPGHHFCGWNWVHSAPCFQVGQEEKTPVAVSTGKPNRFKIEWL